MFARIWLAFVVVFLQANLLLSALSAQDSAGPKVADQQPAPANSIIKISPETTVVVEPVDEQGYVKVIEAVNRKLNQGVTAENNALVPWMQAYGPVDLTEDISKEFWRRLGIKPLPAEGDYLVDSSQFAQQRKLNDDERDDFFDRMSEAQERPWQAANYPLVAAWVAANEKPLAKIVEGSRRERYYAPLVAPDDETPAMIAVLLPTIQRTRSAARLLSARAMLHAGAGEFDKAADDLLACHRLGRLVGQGPTLIDALVGIAIDGIANQGDVALAGQPKLSARQAKRYATELGKLPPLPKMVDKIDYAERLMYVDAVISIARSQDARILTELGDARKLLQFLGQPIDWNETLKVGNQWYDKLVAAMRNPDDEARRAAFEKFDEELTQSAKLMRNPLVLAAIPLMDADTRRTYLGRQMGQVLSALLLPALNSALQAELRATAMFDLSRVSLALAAYHADKGAYPANLEALTKKYLDAVPTDPFSGKPLVYRPQPSGYALYSLGPNRKDDNGADHRAAWDEGRDDYDLTVRMPVEAKDPK